MTLPTTFLPAITRVYEVLCKGQGASRTLTVGRFRPRLYPGQDADNQHKEAVAAEGAAQALLAAGVIPGIVFVCFESGEDGSTQEFSDRSDNRARLRVDVSYATDSAAKRSYGNPTVDLVALAMTQAASDALAIRGALDWPPNMPQTQAALDTGIPGGGGIVFESWGPVRYDAANQLVTVSVYFRAIVFLAFATTPSTLDLTTLTFARASSATYLTSAPTDGTVGFIATAGSNVLRLENRGDGRGALALIETTYTNQLIRGRDLVTSWISVGAPTVTGNAGPGIDGTVVATRVQASSAQARYRASASGAAGGQPETLSVWLRRWSTAGNLSMQCAANQSFVGFADVEATAYVRISATAASSGGPENCIAVEGRLWGAQDSLVDFVQLETGRYPHAAVATVASAVTVAADSLTAAAAVAWMLSGPISVAVISPIFTDTDLQNGDVRWLWTYGGSSDGVRISKSSGFVKVEALQGGVVKASSAAFTFPRHGAFSLIVNPATGVVTVNGTAGPTGTPWSWVAAGAGLRIGGIFGGSGSEADCRFSTTWTNTP